VKKGQALLKKKSKLGIRDATSQRAVTTEKNTSAVLWVLISVKSEKLRGGPEKSSEGGRGGEKRKGHKKGKRRGTNTRLDTYLLMGLRESPREKREEKPKMVAMQGRVQKKRKGKRWEKKTGGEGGKVMGITTQLSSTD